MSRPRSGRGNIRAGSMSSTACRKRQPEKFKGSSYGMERRSKYDRLHLSSRRSPGRREGSAIRKAEIMQALTPAGTLRIGASELEYRMIGPAPTDAPTIVMLHEGLGSAALWGDFPDRLGAAPPR